MASRLHPPGEDDPAARRDPFHVAPPTRLTRAALAAARPLLSRVAGVDGLRQAYRTAQQASGPSFEARVLRALDVRVEVATSDPGIAIPAHGPVILASNHPTGALDGVVLAEVVRQVRPDVRLMVNHLLHRIPELAESCFFVDPFGGAAAAERSRRGLRGAHRWLRHGGALVVFPAGEVAWQGDDTPRDSAWQKTMARLAVATGAWIVPVHIEGRNSRLFYAAGRVHPLLRTLLLGRELLRQRGATVRVAIGAPRAAVEGVAARDRSADNLTSTVRADVEALAGRHRGTRSEPIAAPVDPALLERDVAGLQPRARLLTSGAYDVVCAGAVEIPHVLREIGRLREIAFREAGEGTGRASDLDRFDDRYEHLFVWNRRTREVAGAYRVGATDRIVPEHGIDGLYTSTLFRYDPRILERLGPSLELGRAFVRPEYQRSHSALLLLWKGIGRLVARAPRYRVLFGPVSISNRYQDTSQQLLRAFLAHEHGNASLAALVEARTPPSALVPPARTEGRPSTVEELDALVARIEGNQGIPVLLRQYLRLNATLLGFNVDPSFGDSLDALMMVDLMRLAPALLQRYLGADTGAFLRHHEAAAHRAA